MGSKITRGTSALLMIGTISLSGVAGFTGTYLANNLKGEAVTPPASYITSNSLVSTETSSSTVSSATEKTTKDNITLTATNKASGTTLSIREIAELTVDSVVEITTETVSTSSRMRQYVSEGAGSGVIISKDGYIVTNNHVIDGASKITVKTSDKKSYTATLIGKDSKTDLAVLKIDATDLKAATYGDSSKLVVGELAVAIGNPLGELGGTVTEGIISALNRDVTIDGQTMNLLQTSAAINPGNSGGGLFNEYGELIGVVNAKSSGSDIEGLGFAIPVNTVMETIDSIIKYGYVQGRIETGLTLLDILDTQTARRYGVPSLGVYVQEVTDNSSKLKAVDRIVSVDGTQINDSSEFKQIIEKHKVGDTLSITVSRAGSSLQVKLTLKQANS